jgi:LysR family carnitine catabolism transcriptional activator
MIDDHFVAVCPEGHPLLASEEVHWVELLKFPIIALSRLSSTGQAMESVARELGASMDLMCEVSQIATAGRMVAAGLGVAALPSLSFRQISSEGLDWRPLVTPYVPRTLGIITPTRHSLSSAATAMLEVVRRHSSRLE